MSLEDSISLAELAAGTNTWYNVTDSVRNAVEQLVKHASSQNRRIRHLEDALHRVENSATRTHDKFDGRLDIVLDEMESVRACAVDSSIQSDDIRHRVQQLELKLLGCGMDVGHSCDSPGSRPRSSLGSRRHHAGLPVLDRLDNLESSVDGVSRVANKAKDEFEATNACVYEMEKRLEERFVEVRADVSLASAECKQQTVSEAVRTTKLQLDNLQDRLNSRIQGMEQHQQAELASTAQQAEARVGEAEARVAEAELEMGTKLQALSELVDHTAKAGSQAMSHMSRLEAHSKADIQGLDEAVQRVAEQKVDASGMDTYTEKMSKLFEASARQVRKEALQHADALHHSMQQQLQSRLEGKADAAALQSESQSSRQQLSELWAEAEGCREGLEGVRASLDKLDTTMHSIKDNAATTKERVRELEHNMGQGQDALSKTNEALHAETARRQETDQHVHSLSGAVSVMKETLYGPVLPTGSSSSPTRSRPVSPVRRAAAGHGSLVAQLTSVSERVEGLHSRLQHKADKEGLQEVKQQLHAAQQQGQQCSQALADLKGCVRQQGQEQATALNRLDALITTCAHERPTSSEVRQWLERVVRQGQEGVSGRVAPLETALQRLTAAVEEDKAQALSVAGDYTPQALQGVVEAGAEGVQGLQRQVAALQQSSEEGLKRQGADLGDRLQVLHHHYHRQQDLLQVTGESLREVVREVGARLTPQEGRGLTQSLLRDRDQKDSDQWQSLVTRFTGAFEETKQELQAMTNDLDRSLSLSLAGKLNSADLPQKLQDANLITRTTLTAHLKQVEAGCQRVCGSLGSEVHRLALQVQVLEETDTLAQEAEADLTQLRRAISKKADKEAVEADLDRIHQALRCKANVHAMSEALSQKLDIHSYLTAKTPASKIGAYDPSASPSSGKRRAEA